MQYLAYRCSSSINYNTVYILSFLLQKPLGKTNSNLYVAVPSTPTDNEYVIQSSKPTKAIVRERFKHPRITELLEVQIQLCVVLYSEMLFVRF